MKKYLYKITSLGVVLTMIIGIFSPLEDIFALVNPSGSSINAPNITLTNSGNYNFNLNFSGTLDTGDVVNIDLTDASGTTVTLTGSNNGSGGISFTGIDLRSLVEGSIVFSGNVANSGSVLVASGITASGVVKDTISPSVILTGNPSSGSTIATGSTVSITGTLNESGSNFNSGSITLTGGTMSGFTLSGTTFSFNAISGTASLMTIQVGSGVFSDAVGNTNSTGSNILTYNVANPSFSSVNVRNITQTGAIIDFNFNFSGGTGSAVVYTGGVLSNLVETGVTSLTFSGGTGSGTSVFTDLTGATNYNFLISLTDNTGAVLNQTGTFTTASLPVTLSGTVTNTGATTLTGTISVGSTLSLSGVTINISSNQNDTGFITGSLSISGVNIVVTGSTAWNGILLPPTLISPFSSQAAIGSEIGTGIVVLETIKAGAEGASLVASGGFFNLSFAVPGSSSGNVIGLYRSDDGLTWTGVTPDSSCTLNSSLLCSFRTDHLSFFAVTSSGVIFNFTNVTNASLNTVYTSSITVSGLGSGGAAISISGGGGEYQIGSGAFTTATGTVNNGDVVTVRLTSSNNFSTAATTTLTIGGNSASFSVTTQSSGGSGGGGGGGGGGSIITQDVCPGGDTSPSYYDRICSGTGVTGTGITGTGITGGVGGLLPSFTDIDTSFARDDIIDFASRGILVGYPDGTFRPNNPITRAEFLGVTMKTLNIPLDTNVTTSYTDIPASWIIPYVVKARQLGIAYGQVIDGVLKFRPNDPITRAEAVTMLLNAAKITISTSIMTTDFTDIPIETSWAIKYIETAKQLGIISGQISTNGNPIFRPNDPITRAESVRIIKNGSNVNQ